MTDPLDGIRQFVEREHARYQHLMRTPTGRVIQLALALEAQGKANVPIRITRELALYLFETGLNTKHCRGHPIIVMNEPTAARGENINRDWLTP